MPTNEAGENLGGQMVICGDFGENQKK